MHCVFVLIVLFLFISQGIPQIFKHLIAFYLNVRIYDIILITQPTTAKRCPFMSQAIPYSLIILGTEKRLFFTSLCMTWFATISNLTRQLSGRFKTLSGAIYTFIFQLRLVEFCMQNEMVSGY